MKISKLWHIIYLDIFIHLIFYFIIVIEESIQITKKNHVYNYGDILWILIKLELVLNLK